jgi:hypothetical protein
MHTCVCMYVCKCVSEGLLSVHLTPSVKLGMIKSGSKTLVWGENLWNEPSSQGFVVRWLSM